MMPRTATADGQGRERQRCAQPDFSSIGRVPEHHVAETFAVGMEKHDDQADEQRRIYQREPSHVAERELSVRLERGEARSVHCDPECQLRWIVGAKMTSNSAAMRPAIGTRPWRESRDSWLGAWGRGLGARGFVDVARGSWLVTRAVRPHQGISVAGLSFLEDDLEA